MKTGIVESIQGNGGYEGKFGYVFTSEYTIDNGDFGVAGHKNETPTYKVGDTVTYEIEKNDYGVKIKFVKPDYSGNSNPSPSSPQSTTPTPKEGDMLTGIALKYATMVKCAYIAKGSDFDEDQLRAEVEMMKNIMLGK